MGALGRLKGYQSWSSTLKTLKKDQNTSTPRISMNSKLVPMESNIDNCLGPFSWARSSGSSNRPSVRTCFNPSASSSVLHALLAKVLDESALKKAITNLWVEVPRKLFKPNAKNNIKCLQLHSQRLQTEVWKTSSGWMFWNTASLNPLDKSQLLFSLIDQVDRYHVVSTLHVNVAIATWQFLNLEAFQQILWHKVNTIVFQIGAKPSGTPPILS